MPLGRPFNSLQDVKKMLRNGNYRVNGNALQSAWDDFLWGNKDIARALMNLDESMCYKSEKHHSLSPSVVDYYRADGLMDGEDVYTHFYVREGKVIISSFKEK